MPAARAVYYVALVILFGASVFPLYVGQAGRDALSRGQAAVLSAAALVGLLAWLWAFAASLDDTGDVLTTVQIVLIESGFRVVWLVRLGTALVLILAALVRPSLVAVPAAVLLACEGWSGHAAAWGPLGSVSLALHALCAALWLGGLMPLAEVVRSSYREGGDLPAAEKALRRFSNVAMLAVAGIAVTGAINTWHVLGASVAFTDAYVHVLALKIALVALMIGLAALNRFRFLPQVREANSALLLRSLVGSIAAEQVIGLLVLLDVGVLGTMNPHG
ncbi:CopD family protein [Methylobacterium sp. WSM2598]|uniref:CopD family protein n=1 Tax=Methylobacterium sp. WSM2598 TaxID=398261 RepID=UPI001F01E8EE|nr:CopD family protein [Methylobacterium sp. WSM2598]